MKKSFVERVARLFLSYMCSFVLFAFLSFICIRITLFRPAFMCQQIENSHYVTNVHEEINEKIQDLGRGSNIPPDKVKNIVGVPFVEKNMAHYVKALYADNSFTLQGENELRQTIYKSVKQYMQ